LLWAAAEAALMLAFVALADGLRRGFGPESWRAIAFCVAIILVAALLLAKRESHSDLGDSS